MANKNQAVGLRPHGELYRARKYIASGTVYPGDPVAIATDGKVSASVTVPLAGVSLQYAIAGQEVMIADHPDQMFEVQANGTATITQADIQGNFDLTLGTASVVYKRSSTIMNSDTSDNTVATLAVKLLAIGDELTQEEGSNFVDVIVKINNHVQNGGTGTAGLA
jgi:hypothetical protein